TRRSSDLADRYSSRNGHIERMGMPILRFLENFHFMFQQDIQLIAFDLDGTLLDSVPDLAVAADQAVQALGFPSVSEVQVRDYVGNGADILIGRALSQSLTIDPSLSDELRGKARELFDDFYQQTRS